VFANHPDGPIRQKEVPHGIGLPEIRFTEIHNYLTAG
jgi:hypothetical protein